MIEKTIGWKVGEEVFATIEAAQAAEIEAIFRESDDGKNAAWGAEAIANIIVSKQGRVMDILTTNEKSRPRARKANGGKKTRMSKAQRALADEVIADAKADNEAMRAKIEKTGGVV